MSCSIHGWSHDKDDCPGCAKTSTMTSHSGSAVARYHIQSLKAMDLSRSGYWVRAEDHDHVVRAKDAEIARLTAELEAESANADAWQQKATERWLRAKAADAASLQAEQRLEGLKDWLRKRAIQWLHEWRTAYGDSGIERLGARRCANELLARLDAKE